jgi:hypothetical protein
MSSYRIIVNKMNPVVFAHKGFLRPYACLS